ncbi:MAG: DUF2207 domain-containing protein [Bacteroidaceae bacterium]|nr:DUF2207 domain-containing protein [Bacteroidaceae bacterium]
MLRKIMFLLLLCLAIGVHAQHELSELKIYVLLLPNGDAVVEEDRTMYLADQGTEVYEKMNGLEDREMRISDFGVSDSIYGDYQLVGWDVNQSRAWKAGRCGINTTEEGLELCWGFGEPGPHTFTTSYVLHNLVQSYTDYDGFNHCFYDAANPPAEYVQLALWASDTTIVLSPENAGIWHFKYHGDAWFSESGKVLLKSTQALDNGDKVVLMMQFKKGLFSPEVKHDETFESRVKERAFIDSDYTMDDPGEGSKSSFMGGDDESVFEHYFYIAIGLLVFIGLPLFAILKLILHKPLERRRKRKLILKVLGNVDEVPYYREPPLGGNLIGSQRILKNTLGMLDVKTTFGTKEFTEALLLRLLYKGNIDIAMEQNEKGETRELFRIQEPVAVSSNDNVELKASDKSIIQEYIRKKYSIISSPADDEEMERGLQDLLYRAAGDDHLLQPDELKTFIQNEKNVLSVRDFASKLSSAVDNRYSSEFAFKNTKPEEARQVFGFWEYLNDFSIIGEREVVEVKLWKDYLVFGALYGMAKKVREGMKKICPDYTALDGLTRRFLEESSGATDAFSYVSLLSIATYDTIRYSSTYETAFERQARLEREARAERERRYSGGGGHSSFGGGGGFSGGGGSGVR